jgi:hypothetical protein
VPRPHQSVLFVARVLFAISAKEDEVNCRDIDPGQRGKLKRLGLKQPSVHSSMVLVRLQR